MRLENLVLNNGQLRFEDHARNIAVELPLWRINVHAQAASALHQVYLETQKPGRAIYEGRPLTIQGVSADLQYNFDDSSLKIAKVIAYTPDSRVELSGGVKNLSQPELDLKFTTEVQTETITRFAGIQEDIKGRVV